MKHLISCFFLIGLSLLITIQTLQAEDKPQSVLQMLDTIDGDSQSSSQASEVVNEVAEVVGSTDFSSKPQFYFSYNLIGSQMNDTVDHPTADAALDDSAYHFEANIVWKSKKPNPFGTKNTVKSYYAFHAIQSTTTGIDADDDSNWAEKTTSIYFTYGQKYYLNEGYQGFGFGWYGGIGQSSGSNGYWWYSTSGTATPYEDEDEFAIIVAGELFYHIEYKNLYLAPRVIGGIDKKTGEFSFWPQVMLGVTF